MSVSPTAPALLETPTPNPPARAGIRLGSVNASLESDKESISVFNDTNLTVRLQGWQLVKDGGPSYSFGDLLLFPGSGVMLYTGSGEDSSVARYWGQEMPVWMPGSVAKLLNRQGEVVYTIEVE